MAINEEDILSYNFFQYGTPFFGSFCGKNYRIARNPLKNVFFDNDPHKNDDATFEVTMWEGMDSFATTKEQKVTEHFPFTADGRLAAIAWLNARCGKEDAGAGAGEGKGENGDGDEERE